MIIFHIEDKNEGNIVDLINSYIEKLRERVKQVMMKNVLKADPDGSPWVLSYPGRYLQFPHNFEKV